MAVSSKGEHSLEGNVLASKSTLRMRLAAALAWVLICLMILPFMPQVGYAGTPYAQPSYFYMTNLQGEVIYASDSRVPVSYSEGATIDINDLEGIIFYLILKSDWDENGSLIVTDTESKAAGWRVKLYADGYPLDAATHISNNWTSHGETYVASDGYPYPPGSNVDPELWNADGCTYMFDEYIWSKDANARLFSAEKLDVQFLCYGAVNGVNTYIDERWVSFGLTGGTSQEEGDDDPAPSGSVAEEPPEPESQSPNPDPDPDQDPASPSTAPDEPIDGDSEDGTLAGIDATGGNGTGTDDMESDIGNPFESTDEANGAKKNIDPLANAYRDYLQKGSNASDHASDGEVSSGDGEDWETSALAEPTSLQTFFQDKLPETSSANGASASNDSMTELPATGTVYRVASGSNYQSVFDGAGDEESSAAASVQQIAIVGIPVWVILWAILLFTPLLLGAAFPLAAYSRKAQGNTRLIVK